MLSRLGEAVKDAAETLRRAFQDHPVHGVALNLPSHPRDAFEGLSAPVRSGLEALAATPGGLGTLPTATLREGSPRLEARLQVEAAFGNWSSGAKLAEMPVFRAERCARLEVPALPKAPKVSAFAAGAFPTGIRKGLEALQSPTARGLPLSLGEVGSRRGLDLALRLPLAVEGLDLREAPRALQMRYGMLAVKATGENVRNLELLGRYLIPRKGVRELRHDARTGRLLVLLGPEAAGARKDPLLLARRKDDQSLLTTFLEEG
jgi:hypothetical protein